MSRKITLKKVCTHCGKEYVIQISSDQLRKYNDGELVQRAFPELTPGERELFFKTGVCDDCWDKMFSPLEDFTKISE